MAMEFVAASSSSSAMNTDIFDHSGNVFHPKDRFGAGLSDKELQQKADATYVVPHSGTLPFIDGTGVWTTTRRTLKERGDERSALQRQRSIEEVGISEGIRGVHGSCRASTVQVLFTLCTGLRC